MTQVETFPSVWDGLSEKENKARERPCFSDELVADLARRFSIEPERIPDLKRRLEIWASVYWGHLEDGKLPRAGSIRPPLVRIRSLAARLRKTIESLHPHTARLFWTQETFLHSLMHQQAPEHPHFGSRVFEISPDRFLEVPIDRESHLASLKLLEDYAQREIDWLGKGKGGQQRDPALSIWVHNVRSYWLETLGRRRFGPKTGGSFCIAAFSALNPSREAARRLGSTMRGILNDERSKKTSTRKK